MKRILSYPELWQKKRNELPVNSSPDADWKQMSSLLDKQMPVSGMVKKPFRFKMPKWGMHVFVGVSSVVAVYVGYQLYHSKKHQNLVKPNTQQIHRDSLALAANDTSSTRDTVNPSIGTSTVTGIPPLAGNQTKLGTDSASKGEQNIDSIMAPAILNASVHRDSIIAPIEAVPQKAVRDSMAPVNLEKKDIQKDTSNTNKKTPKKRKRSKLSVFF